MPSNDQIYDILKIGVGLVLFVLVVIGIVNTSSDMGQASNRNLANINNQAVSAVSAGNDISVTLETVAVPTN